MTPPEAGRIRAMTPDDYDAVLALMRESPGVAVRAADSREAVARYLARNPGLSFVAETDGRVVGCAFGGHDGRRGYLHHLAVAADHRRRGIGTALATAVVEALAMQGIFKTHLDVFADNEAAISFWRSLGWQQRDDIVRFSFNRSDDPNI